MRRLEGPVSARDPGKRRKSKIVNGLAAAAIYHLLVTLSAVPPAQAAPCGITDDGSTIFVPSNYATFVPPAKGASYTEEFGGSSACQIERVTNGHVDVGSSGQGT